MMTEIINRIGLILIIFTPSLSATSEFPILSMMFAFCGGFMFLWGAYDKEG